MTLQLEITGMAFGGHGVARHEGKVYFVRGGIPGDLVKAEVINESSRFSDAIVTSIIRKSTLRDHAPCPQYETCGGCQWQDIPYQTQLTWKTEFVQTALRKIAKLDIPLENITVYPSPQTFHYRNRVLLRVHVSSQGIISCGYFKRESRELVAINTCKIADELIDQFISQLSNISLPDAAGEKWRMELQSVLDRENKKRLIITVYPSATPITKQQNAALTFLQQRPDVAWAGYAFDTENAPAFLYDQQSFKDKKSFLDIDFFTRPGQFQQVNLHNNHTLRDLIYKKVRDLNPKRVLDLFCGSGNLSIPLIQQDRYIEGCENNRHAKAIAHENTSRLAKNFKNNFHYLTQDANKHLRNLVKRDPPKNLKFDLVLLDPPRQGMREGMSDLLALAPKDIIYVSCDPNTLSRDLFVLCRNHSYKIESVAALDFFPHTYHIESVVHLSRQQ